MKHRSMVITGIAVLALATVASADLTFKVGNSTGSIQEITTPPVAVNVVPLSPVDDGDEVILQLDKIWLFGGGGQTTPFLQLNNAALPSPIGIPAGPSVIIVATLPSATDAGQAFFDIVIGDEKLSNQTSVAWTDFHIEIFVSSGDGTIEVTGEPNTGPRLPLWQLVEDSGDYKFDFYGGLWPNDSAFGTLFDNNIVNKDKAVRIRITLGQGETQVVIKEWPTIPVPEPATMGLLGLGTMGLALLRRRRRRK